MTEPIETGSVAARIVEAMLKAGVDASPDGFKGDVAVVVEHGRTLVAGGTHREADRMRSALRRAAGARPAGRGMESLTESLKRAEAELVAVRIDDGEGGPLRKVGDAMPTHGGDRKSHRAAKLPDDRTQADAAHPMRRAAHPISRVLADMEPERRRREAKLNHPLRSATTTTSRRSMLRWDAPQAVYAPFPQAMPTRGDRASHRPTDTGE